MGELLRSIAVVGIAFALPVVVAAAIWFVLVALAAAGRPSKPGAVSTKKSPAPAVLRPRRVSHFPGAGGLHLPAHK